LATPGASPVHVFAERAWEQYLELNPLWATSQGDERWDDRLDDPGPVGRSTMLALVDAWEAEIAGFSSLELSVEDSITLDLIGIVIDRSREADALRLWQMEAIDQHGGPQGLVGDLARIQRAASSRHLQQGHPSSSSTPTSSRRRGRPSWPRWSATWCRHSWSG
jgi:uncharacterized protein (DUF885 family)